MFGLIRLFLPILFPSWRFFEEIGPSPRIETRLVHETAWKPLDHLPNRLGPLTVLRRLFHAPEWNARLYLVSTAIRHAVEPTPHTQSTLEALIAARLGTNRPFVFRIVFHVRDGDRIGVFIEYESGIVNAGQG